MEPLPIRLDDVDGLVVVRDDLIPGGTKARVLPRLLAPGMEYVYAGPAYGYAQVALAYACRAVGAQATIFVAKRREPHRLTREAIAAGALAIAVPYGYLTNVQAKARAYAETTGATLLPFGFDSEDFVAALAEEAGRVEYEPREVWTVAGSGTLSRALQRVWPDAEFHAVALGRTPGVGSAHLHHAPERFEDDAQRPPPFPSCRNYDAKAWRFCAGRPGALFWNVAP